MPDPIERPAPKSATLRVNDGAIQFTYGTGPTSLLTVRGKDHELGYSELRELADAFDQAAKRAALHHAIGALFAMSGPPKCECDDRQPDEDEICVSCGGDTLDDGVVIEFGGGAAGS